MLDDNKFVLVKLDKFASEKIDAPRYSYWNAVFRNFFSKKLNIVMLVILCLVIGMSFIQPLFGTYDFMNTQDINDFTKRYNPPSWDNWFGTDANAHSLFDAVWAGARNSILIGALATVIACVTGVLVGMIWGLNRKIDRFLISVYNIVSNIPDLLIVLILAFTFGNGFFNLVFAMSITPWISCAYMIRVQVIIMRDREYNLASKCLGTSTWKLITKNILPYLISVIMTYVSRMLPAFISYEVFLSFMGIGLGMDVPSLGRLISKYTSNITEQAYLFWIPVAVSALVAISLFVVGQALADAADPKTHR